MNARVVEGIWDVDPQICMGDYRLFRGKWVKWFFWKKIVSTMHVDRSLPTFTIF